MAIPQLLGEPSGRPTRPPGRRTASATSPCIPTGLTGGCTNPDPTAAPDPLSGPEGDEGDHIHSSHPRVDSPVRSQVDPLQGRIHKGHHHLHHTYGVSGYGPDAAGVVRVEVDVQQRCPRSRHPSRCRKSGGGARLGRHRVELLGYGADKLLRGRRQVGDYLEEHLRKFGETKVFVHRCGAHKTKLARPVGGADYQFAAQGRWLVALESTGRATAVQATGANSRASIGRQ